MLQRCARDGRSWPAVLMLVLAAAGLSGCTRSARPAGAVERAALPARLDRIVPELMARHRVPGVAIAVVDATGPIHLRGYGYADPARARAVSETTVFEGASLGKPLFAYALMQHHTDPAFDLERPIVACLGQPPVADPAGSTLHAAHLLSHSSGLAFDAAAGRRYLAFEPGTRWQYSGLGYAVLQEAATACWKESWPERVRRTVTAPLGMAVTDFLPVTGALADRSVGHDRQGRPLPATHWAAPSAASSLHTSARDYGRFLSAMLAGLDPNNGDHAASMLEIQVPVDAGAGLSWGLGWAVARAGSDTLFLHWGSNPGYKSLALGSLQQGLGLVVLSNGDHGLELATALVPEVYGQDYPVLDFYMLHPDD